jgi:DNA adenine methylase
MRDTIKPITVPTQLDKPFLRWPGGKRWLVPVLKQYASKVDYKRYIEPFLGGGALFFSLPTKNSIISDVNFDLINTYHQIRINPQAIINGLKELPINSQTYEKQRLLKSNDLQLKAIRFLYLNRTSFNGLYRVNRNGIFNVPFAKGTRNTNLLTNTDLLFYASRKLKSTTIINSDFKDVLSEAIKGDLVFCDPTYTVKHNNNGFRRYNEVLFSWEDQERLAKICLRAAKKGTSILISNAYHKEIKSLFRDFKSRVVYRQSLLAASAACRSETREYLFFT